MNKLKFFSLKFCFYIQKFESTVRKQGRLCGRRWFVVATGQCGALSVSVCVLLFTYKIFLLSHLYFRPTLELKVDLLLELL